MKDNKPIKKIPNFSIEGHKKTPKIVANIVQTGNLYSLINSTSV